MSWGEAQSLVKPNRLVNTSKSVLPRWPWKKYNTALVRAMIRPRSPWRLLIAILTLLILPSAPTLQAQDYSNPSGYLLAQSEEGQVWVNTATGIYHYPGTRWYGKTNQGKFMTEKDAIA